MKIRILTILICFLFLVSTANAFEFKGFNYKWGAHRTEVIITDSSIGNNPSTKNVPEKIFYAFQSEWGPAWVFYLFENDYLKAAALSYKPNDTKYGVYYSIKRDYENKIGEVITVDHKSCWLLSDDAFISIIFFADEGLTVVQYQPSSPEIREEYASLVNTKKEQEAATARKVQAEKNLQIQAKIEKRGPVIHGFYIGMPLTETIKLLNEKYSQIISPWGDLVSVSDYNSTLSKLPVKPLTKSAEYDAGYGAVCRLKYDKFFIHKNAILNNSDCTFKGNEDGELIEINLTAEVVNKLFNVADMSAGNFVQAFIDAYNIPEMSAELEYPLSWWEYTDPDGFKIKIYDDKTIRMEKVAKAKERNFG